MSQDNPITNHVQPALDKVENNLQETLDKNITVQPGGNPVEGVVTAPARVAVGSLDSAARLVTVGTETATNGIADGFDALEALGKGALNKFTPVETEYKAAHQPKPQMTDTLGGKVAYTADAGGYQLDRALETLTEDTGSVIVNKRLGGDTEHNLGAKIGATAINVVTAPVELGLGAAAVAGKFVAHGIKGGAEVAATVEHGIGEFFVGAGNLMSEPQARINQAATEEPKIGATHVDAPITKPAKPIEINHNDDTQHKIPSVDLDKTGQQINAKLDVLGALNELSTKEYTKAIEEVIGSKHIDGKISKDEIAKFKAWSESHGVDADRDGNGKIDRHDLGNLTAPEVATVVLKAQEQKARKI